MSPAFLRPAPPTDARPEPLHPSVVQRASRAREDEIATWLKPRVPALTTEQISFALQAALIGGGADGFRCSTVLREKFGWPVDMELCGYVRDTCNALAFALRIETRVWVARTGVRFPGKSGDSIEWLDERDDGQRQGQLIAVDRDYASAVVQPISSLIKAGPPRTVFAEHVLANITQALYPSAPGADRPTTPELVCPACNGLGMIASLHPEKVANCCMSCEGTGVIS